MSSILSMSSFGNVLYDKTIDSENDKEKVNSINNVNTEFKSEQIIIKYRKSISEENKLAYEKKLKMKLLKVNKSGARLLKLEKVNLKNTLKNLQLNKDIKYVTYNYIRKINSLPEKMPNDPLYNKQWGLDSIKTKAGWEYISEEKNLKEIKIAIIDTGIDMKHEDLIGKFTSDGKDFCDNDLDPSPGPEMEEHGTQLAGIMVA